MPLQQPEELTALREEVRRTSIRDVRAALERLLAALPPGRPKHNEVLKLLGREDKIAAYGIANRLPFEQLEILRNELLADLLLFTDRLVLADFGEAPPPRPELRPGHFLYRIPRRMRTRAHYECIVRIAHELNQVLRDLEPDEHTVIDSIPVAEVMEVELIDLDLDGEGAFDILLLSSPQQYVDEFSYTEWVFSVRALRAGKHRLAVRVCVLIRIDGQERRKDLVLRREVEVTSDAGEEAEEAPPLRRVFLTDVARESGAIPPVADPFAQPPVIATPMAPPPPVASAPPPPPPPPVPVPAPRSEPAPRSRRPSAPRGRSSSSRRMLSVAASIALLVVAALFFLPVGQAGDGFPDNTAAPSDKAELPGDDPEQPPVGDTLVAPGDTLQ